MSSQNTPFLDFQDVWLAYNEDLLAQNRFAVEGIVQVHKGEFIAIVGPSAAVNRPS